MSRKRPTADRPPASGEPSTEAGRKLLDDIGYHAFLDGTHIEDRILAIETEARATPPALDVELVERVLFAVFPSDDATTTLIFEALARLSDTLEEPKP